MSAGYNTRKVSLSLPSLGIALPGNHAAARRNHPASAAATTTATSTPARPGAPASPKSQTANRKRKASHDGDSQSPRPASQPRKLAPPRPGAASKLEPTPPPSPTASVEMMDSSSVVEPRPVDMDSINDDIVEAVIRVLISQGNRPHLVKELATILMLQLRIVQQSANPCAIISSRLATFLKRPCWTASSPCPLAKELETVHPRRTYFYLTTCPHPPFSDSTVSTPIIKRAIITPSLSSGTSASEDADDLERRRVLSPSPEVDLSAPEFDDLDDDLPMPTTPSGSFSSRFPSVAPHHHHHHHAHSRHHRSASPPLEKDEKEFTQTANVLQQKRKATGHLLAAAPADSVVDVPYNSRDENLFGGLQHKALSPTAGHHIINFSVTSPSMRPSFAANLKRDIEADGWARLDSMLEWDRSPENVELDELDGLLVDF